MWNVKQRLLVEFMVMNYLVKADEEDEVEDEGEDEDEDWRFSYLYIQHYWWLADQR